MELVILSHVRVSEDFRKLCSLYEIKMTEEYFILKENRLFFFTEEVYEHEKPGTFFYIKIIESVCYFQREKEGYLITICENGNIQSEEHYNKGCLVGVSRHYNFDSGKLLTEVSHHEGYEHGISKHYYSNGQVSSEEVYRNGEEHNLWIEYYENGQKEKEGSYVNSLPVGTWRYWKSDGTFEKEVFHIPS